jgi:hypothetical protein
MSLFKPYQPKRPVEMMPVDLTTITNIPIHPKLFDTDDGGLIVAAPYPTTT